MKSTRSRAGRETNEKDSAREKAATDPSSAAITGGAPATEEDIGTEGAGTEPRGSTQTKRGTGSSSKDAQRKRGAT